MRRTPVFLLTGFLGAGKSTLLNRLLRDPAFAKTAIIINEFGEIALDHDLVRVADAPLSRTTTGCLCCTAGSDVRSTLHELHQAALGGGIDVERIVVETTGLADPAPLVNQLIPGGTPARSLGDHIVARHYALAGVVTLVDIVTGELSIENHFEAAKQIAFADRIVLTKTDLARDPATIKDIGDLRERLAMLNPTAPVSDAASPDFQPASLFAPRTYTPAGLGDDVLGWLTLDEAISSQGHGGRDERPADDENAFRRHGARIGSFSLTLDRPVDAASMSRFLDVLTASAGQRLLRVKGLVQVADDPGRPRLVHAVQHSVHPPTVLEEWPSDDRRTRLVFITDGLDTDAVRQLFAAALVDGTHSVQESFASLCRVFAKAWRSGKAALQRTPAR
ncbi:CobW family GTP-binding protein [Mangrovicella endophytica]|uniref:CobW family GTP-binding protein n=1 Tax=Mangrovicella endophytica TaxID=2066697 RepID=UPI000C9DE072|nr:GTP-binding protein [Mangrovicella endophytica]